MKNECEYYLINLGKAITRLKSSMGYYGLNEITEFENEYYKNYSAIDSLIENINEECNLNLVHTNFYGSDDIFLSGKSENEFRKLLNDIYDPLEDFIRINLNQRLNVVVENDSEELKDNNEDLNDIISDNAKIIINNSNGVVIGSNHVSFDIQDSFNKVYDQLNAENPENKEEIKEILDELKEELQKEDINQSKINKGLELVKRISKLDIPEIKIVK